MLRSRTRKYVFYANRRVFAESGTMNTGGSRVFRDIEKSDRREITAVVFVTAR